MGGGRDGVRRITEGVELTKVKYTHNRDILGNPFEQ
jgi:hypothetical protein